MADRRIQVRYEALHQQFMHANKQMVMTTRWMSAEIHQASLKQQQDFDRVGKSVLVAGAAVAFGLKQAVDAAVSFESAFAGVRKTVDASQAEFEVMSRQFRNLAKELPTSVEQLSAIGEAAGQLGIHKQNIVGFTKVMADLGETTNLAGSDGATQLARLANITQMNQTQFDRLGSTVVDLGNNLATTEAEIVQMGLRIAGAGNQIGLTEAQILAFAGSLSSVGIEAQAGGTAISRVMIELAKSVAEGGGGLEMFADVAGMTSAKFAHAFKTDAAGAVITFIEGLGKISNAGENVFAVLEELGLNEIRVRDALLRASGAGDLFRQSIELGSKAWEENTALTIEAEKRYETTAAKVEMARNRINDFAIDIGGVLLPAVGAGAEVLGDMVGMLQALPGPMRTAATGAATVGSGAAIMGGALMLAVGQINRNRVAMQALGAQALTTRSVLASTAGLLTGPWAAAIGVTAVLLGTFVKWQADAKRAAEDLNTALDAQTGSLKEGTRAWVEQQIASKGLAADLADAGVSVDLVTDAIMGVPGALKLVNEKLSEARSNFDNFRDIYGGGVFDSTPKRLEGEIDNLTAAFQRGISTRTKAQIADAKYARVQQDVGAGLETVGKAALGATDGVTRIGRETGRWASVAGLVAPALGTSASAVERFAAGMEGASRELLDFKKAIDQVLGIPLSLDETFDNWEAALDDLTASLKKNGKTLDGTTEKGRANKAAFRESVDAALSYAEALHNAGNSAGQIQTRLQDMRDRLIETATKTGMAKDKATEYVNQLGLTPSNITTLVSVVTGRAISDLERVHGLLQALPTEKFLTLRLHTSGAALPPGIVTRHGGGDVSGPRIGGLAADERLIVAQTGEQVLSRRQRQALAPMLAALPRFHRGGKVGTVPASAPLASRPVGFDASAVRAGLGGAGTSARSLEDAVKAAEKLNAEWERSVKLHDDQLRRAELLVDIDKARVEFAKAKTVEEKTSAREGIDNARKALRDFDVDRARDNEQRAISEALAAANTEIARRKEIEANREAFLFSRMSTAEQIADLDRRMAAETQFSDVFMDLHAQRLEVAKRAEDRAKDELGRLNGLLSERRRIQDQMLDAERQFAKSQNEILDRHNEARRAADERFEESRKRVLADRERELVSFARLNERFRPETFGNTAAALIANAVTQTGVLEQMRGALANLRARGLSEEIISALGLDDPRQLRQAMMLTQATDLELAEYNRVVGERTAKANEIVATEARLLVGTVGAGLRDAASVQQRELAAAYQTMVTDLDKLRVDFEARTGELRDQLSQIGVDTGLGYAEAIAEGIAAGLPGILAQVAAVKAAVADLEQANAALAPRGQGVGRVQTPTGYIDYPTDQAREDRRLFQSGQITDAEFRKRVDARLAQIPKAHDGMVLQGSGEQLVMAKGGEAIFSAQDTQALKELVGALRGMSSGGPLMQVGVQNFNDRADLQSLTEQLAFVARRL